MSTDLRALLSRFLEYRVPEDVRGALVNACLWIATTLGALLIGAKLLWDPLYGLGGNKFIFHSLLQCLILAGALWRAGPRWMRLGLLLLFFNILGASDLFLTARAGHASLLLTVGVLLSGILAGGRLLAFSFLLSFVWYSAAAYGWRSGLLPPGGGLVPADVVRAGYWIDQMFGFALSSCALVAAVSFLVDLLIRKGEHERSIQASLMKSEKEMRSLFVTAPVGIAVLRDRKLVRINDQLVELMGYSKEEILGRSPRVFYADDTTYEDVGRRLYDREQGSALSYESVHKRKDGAFIDVLLKSAFVDPGDPNSDAIVMVLDITAQKKAERMLKESGRRFQRLLQNSNDLFLVVDPEGKFASVGGPVETVLGYTPEEMVGRSGYVDVHPDDLEQAKAVFDLALQNPGQTLKNKYRVRHKNGSWVYLETMGTNWLNDPAIRAVILNSRDVTERTLAEEAVRMSEARLREIFDHTSDAIFSVRVEYSGRFVFEEADSRISLKV